MKSNERANKAIAEILDRPSGKGAYESRTWIVQVAKMVQSWRIDAELSQNELAELIGTKQAQISRLESYDNDHMPNVGTLIKIAHACGRRLVIGSKPFEEPNPESLSSVVDEAEGAARKYEGDKSKPESRSRARVSSSGDREVSDEQQDYAEADLISV